MIAITGCGGSSDSPTGAAVKESICNTPYFEYKVGDCCLDKNGNNICDSDETIVEETTTPEETTTTEEVEITLDDSCTDTTYFKCEASYITTDEAFFKLETRRDGFTHIKKVSALGCEKTFADKAKANQGYQIRSDVIISVPCKKGSAGDEIENSDYVIEYIFYPDDVFINPVTGEWEGVTRSLQRSTGQISGTIRNEPKKIL